MFMKKFCYYKALFTKVHFFTCYDTMHQPESIGVSERLFACLARIDFPTVSISASTPFPVFGLNSPNQALSNSSLGELTFQLEFTYLAWAGKTCRDWAGKSDLSPTTYCIACGASVSTSCFCLIALHVVKTYNTPLQKTSLKLTSHQHYNK